MSCAPRSPSAIPARREAPVDALCAAMLVFTALAPVFLIVALGAALQKSGFLSAGFLREGNRLTYWIGLPALLVSQLVKSMRNAGGTESLLVVMFAVTAIVIGIAYLVAAVMRIPWASRGTFVQGAMRGNLAFVGLPIVFALPNVPLAGGIALHSAAVIAVAPTMVLYNVAGVVLLVVSSHAFGRRMIWPVIKQLAITPPLLATLAGMGYAATGWPLPLPLEKALHALGEMALPLGLLGVGGSLVSANWQSAWRAPLAAAILKTAVCSIVAGLCARWLALSHDESRMLMILAASPTAIVSYTLAVEMKGDDQLASTTIALSVIASLPVLIAAVAW